VETRTNHPHPGAPGRRRAAAPSGAGLRVLYVVPASDEETPMVFARREIASVARQGVEVDSFFSSSRRHPVRVAQLCARLRARVRAFDPHVVHAQFGTITALASVIASSAPVVITFRGSDLNWVRVDGAVPTMVRQLVSQAAAARAAHVICVSERLRRRLWIQRERATVLTNGTDLDMFRPVPRGEARAALGWRHDDPVVIFNAGFSDVKRRDLAEAAFERARAASPRLRLEVLDGRRPPDSIPLYLNAADALLLTSDAEGSPAVVREAMACNLPVVSVDVGDVAERLARVRPSCVVARDPVAIARGLLDVLAAGRRSNGAEEVQEVSMDAVARRLVAIYRRVAVTTGFKP
jgi:teichuronic acid biosynthesis glycosyltransferase TuaC